MFTAALIAALALATAADLPPALVVRAPAEAQAAEKLGAALLERMPAVRVVVEATLAGSEDLVVALAAKDDGAWDLVVERAGEQALRRAMPAGASGPDAAFFVSCAAVVERFLQDIDWKGRPVSIDPGSVAEPKPAPIAVVLPRSETPLDWSVEISAAGALGLQGLEQQPGGRTRKEFFRGGPAVDVSVRRAGLAGGLKARVYLPESHTIGVSRPGRIEQTGEVQDLSASAALMGGGCTGGDVSFCGGLQLGWRGTWAWGQSSQQALFQWKLAHSDAFLTGLFARLSIRLPASLELRASLGAATFVGDDGFEVEGAAAPVLAPARYEVGLAVGLARRVP